MLAISQGYTVFSIPVGVVYRPNEAKVRNLKTKDYLGKARLVAASDRSNSFTGFAGSEIKNVRNEMPMLSAMANYYEVPPTPANMKSLGQATGKEAKDDRPTDNISFAASNLVKPGLQSRRQQPELLRQQSEPPMQQSEPPRQQSEPPTSRDLFPPTPPPENERPGISRGASVRNGGPKPQLAKLNMDRIRPSGGFEKTSASPQAQEPRRKPLRTASSGASPAGPSRGHSQRGGTPMSAEEQEYNDDLYDMYQSGSVSRGNRSQCSRRNVPRYIEEEEQDGSSFDDGSFDEGDFEMVDSRRGNSIPKLSRAPSQRTEVRKVRVKVHAAEDVRYVMVPAAIEWPDFVDKIRDKFGLRRRFKIKVQDDDVPDGDMITMGDQDDLDMVLMTVNSVARRQKQEIGKMEVSFLDSFFFTRG